jgi:hypothetical protein
VSPLTGLSGQVNLLPITSWWIGYKKRKTLWRVRNGLCFNSGLVFNAGTMSKGGLHTCAMENPVDHGCKTPSGQRDWGIGAACARTSSLQLRVVPETGHQ